MQKSPYQWGLGLLFLLRTSAQDLGSCSDSTTFVFTLGGVQADCNFFSQVPGYCVLDPAIETACPKACKVECSVNTVIDCDGNEVALHLVGDGICHDGTTSANSWESANLNCQQLQWDGEDCKMVTGNIILANSCVDSLTYQLPQNGWGCSNFAEFPMFCYVNDGEPATVCPLACGTCTNSEIEESVELDPKTGATPSATSATVPSPASLELPFQTQFPEDALGPEAQLDLLLPVPLDEGSTDVEEGLTVTPSPPAENDGSDMPPPHPSQDPIPLPPPDLEGVPADVLPSPPLDPTLPDEMPTPSILPLPLPMNSFGSVEDVGGAIPMPEVVGAQEIPVSHESSMLPIPIPREGPTHKSPPTKHDPAIVQPGIPIHIAPPIVHTAPEIPPDARQPTLFPVAAPDESHSQPAENSEALLNCVDSLTYSVEYNSQWTCSTFSTLPVLCAAPDFEGTPFVACPLACGVCTLTQEVQPPPEQEAAVPPLVFLPPPAVQSQMPPPTQIQAVSEPPAFMSLQPPLAAPQLFSPPALNIGPPEGSEISSPVSDPLPTPPKYEAPPPQVWVPVQSPAIAIPPPWEHGGGISSLSPPYEYPPTPEDEMPPFESPSPPPASSGSDSINVWIIVVIAGGVSVLFLALTMILWGISKRKDRKRKERAEPQFSVKESRTDIELGAKDMVNVSLD